jgi:hypothetical protein
MPGPFFPGYITKGKFSDITSTREHELGTFGFESGRILQYVKFGSGTARYNWVGMYTTAPATGYEADANNTVMTLTTSTTHAPIGVAEYGGTANSFGWITRFGGATAKTSATQSAYGAALLNDGAATGTLGLNLIGGSTFLAIQQSGAGVLCSAASVTGAYVNVRCL